MGLLLLLADGNGRTWADFAHEHATSTVLIVLLLVVALVLFVYAGMAIASYRSIAVAEGREYKMFGFTFGARQQKADVSSNGVISTPPDSKLTALPASAQISTKAVLLFAKASIQIGAAKNDEELKRYEGQILSLMIDHSKQNTAVHRRASILRVESRPNNDAAMVLRRGYPENSFRHKTEFLRSKFHDENQGMCWRAAFSGRDSARKNGMPGVLPIIDVEAEPTYVKLDGHHEFHSILIAPIIWGDKVLGVVCLDAAEKNFYTTNDVAMVTLAAMHIAAAWRMRDAKP